MLCQMLKMWKVEFTKSTVESETPHLHRVRHAVVIIAAIDLGEEVLAHLGKKQ